METYKEVFVVGTFLCLAVFLGFVWMNPGFMDTSVTVVEKSDISASSSIEYSELSETSQSKFRSALSEFDPNLGGSKESVTIWDPTSELQQSNYISLDGDVYRLTQETRIKPIVFYPLVVAGFLFTGFAILTGYIIYTKLIALTESFRKKNRGSSEKIVSILDRLETEQTRNIIFVICTAISLVVICGVILPQPAYSATQVQSVDDSNPVVSADSLSDSEKYELNKLISQKRPFPNSELGKYEYIQSDGELYRITETSIFNGMVNHIGFMSIMFFTIAFFSLFFGVLLEFIITRSSQHLIKPFFATTESTDDK